MSVDAVRVIKLSISFGNYYTYDGLVKVQKKKIFTNRGGTGKCIMFKVKMI